MQHFVIIVLDFNLVKREREERTREVLPVNGCAKIKGRENRERKAVLVRKMMEVKDVFTILEPGLMLKPKSISMPY